MTDIAEKVLPIIRATRSMTLPFYGKVEILAQKDESPHSVVTKIDHDVEKFLEEEFKKLDPTVGFAGEEFGGSREVKKLWLVDPIDGTNHFVRGLPFCTTMVALIEDDQVVFSAIYDFVNDIMYHAEKGKGAFQNNERIHVSNRPARQSINRLESDLSKPENLKLFLELMKESLVIDTICSGNEFVMVAKGQIECRICYDPFGNDYDFAPGSLLVSEAGGIVKNIGSNDYDYRNTNLIAANKPLFEYLTQGSNAMFPIKDK